MSAKCTVCDKTCGSVLRLQDWRCLWCKAMVSEHAGLQARAWAYPSAASWSAPWFWRAHCSCSCRLGRVLVGVVEASDPL